MSLPDTLPQGLWVLDPAHSTVAFAVAHAGVALVWGRFHRPAGRLVVHPARPAAIDAEIEVASLDTGHGVRDRQLLGSSFLDAARHPRMTFRAQDVGADGARLTVAGELEIRGVRRGVRLTGALGGVELDADGDTRLGLSLGGAISRASFGITRNEVLHSGAVLIADEVVLRLDLSAVRRG